MKNSCLKLYWLQDLVCILWVRQLIHRGRFLSIMKGGTSPSTYTSTYLDKKILSFWTHPVFHFKLNSVSSSSKVAVSNSFVFSPRFLEEIFGNDRSIWRLSGCFFRWVETNHQLPSRKLTYPTWGKGKSSTQICQTSGGYVNSLEGSTVLIVPWLPPFWVCRKPSSPEGRNLFTRFSG